MNKKTVIVGASETRSSYAYLAAINLRAKHHEVIPLSIHQGKVMGLDFLDLKSKPSLSNVDTITLYINPSRQREWEEYILSLRPIGLIFNPGTENASLIEKAKSEGIEVVIGCTLVMLSTGQY